MIREIATRKSSTGYKGLFIIIMIAVIVISLSVLVGYLENNFDIYYLEYLIFFMLLGFGVFVLRYFITQYRYSLFDDEFIIERMIGKKLTTVVDVFIWNIISFKKTVEKPTKNIKIIKTYKLFVQHTNKWSLVYKKDDELFEALFNPSENFIRQLNRAIMQRQKKQQREPDIIR